MPHSQTLANVTRAEDISTARSTPPAAVPAPAPAAESPAVAAGASDLRARLSRYTSQKSEMGRETLTDARMTQYQQQSEDVIRRAWARHKQDPHNRELLDWLAYLLYSNRHHADAIPLFKLLVDNPRATTSQHYFLANCYLGVGSLAKAVDHWEIVIQRDKNGEMGKKARARMKYMLHMLGNQQSA